MLDVEIDEEFSILETGLTYKFVDNGLLQKHFPIATWHGDDHTLRCLLSGEYEIIEKPILDVNEIEYLSVVINPFRDRVISIGKCNCYEYEYIVIKYLDNGKNEGFIYFPCFKRGTMYKGMEAGKEYSLGDLRL